MKATPWEGAELAGRLEPRAILVLFLKLGSSLPPRKGHSRR